MNQNQRRVVREVLVDYGSSFWKEGDVEEGTASVFLVDEIVSTLNDLGLDLELKERR